MMRDDFAAAAERASGKTCPINELPAFYTNHWDVCELCRSFTCVECVAEPEDIGLGDYEPYYSAGEEVAWEIPF